MECDTKGLLTDFVMIFSDIVLHALTLVFLTDKLLMSINADMTIDTVLEFARR